MARKQKKLTRKERAQQQQALTERHRQTKGWISPNEKAKQRTELAQDMAPLLTTLKPGPEAEKMKELFWLLADSSDLAEEREFEEIILPPLECAQTFAEVGMELGMEPEALADLAEEEREDRQFEMLEMTTQRLLTDDVRQEIITALDKLRQRLKRAGRTAEAGKAAALQSFLSDRKTRDLWPALGLTQELVRRSMAVGIELMATSFEADELDELERLNRDETPETLVERMTQSPLGQKISGLLQKTPGLGKFFEKEVDKVWDEGLAAVYEGDLYLELFTPEEIEAADNILASAFGIDTADETEDGEKARPELTEDEGRKFVAEVDAYLTERLTEERMAELRTRLQTVLREGNYPPQYTAFIYMVVQHMADAEAAKYEKPFLMHAFVGEIRAAAKMASAEEAEETEEE